MLIGQLMTRLCSHVPGHLLQFARSLSSQAKILPILNSTKCLQLLQSRCNPSEWLQVKSLLDDLNDLKVLAKDADASLETEIQLEEKRILNNLQSLQSVIINGLVRDEDFDVSKAILEIGNGVGGQEAMLFATELLQVYQVYCNSKGWYTSVLDLNESILGGLHEVAIEIKGDNCFRFLRHEAGVHRVQRVPKTEKAGRIHTSTVTVTVVPITCQAKRIDIPAKDLRIQAVCSSAPGGQHVNKTESCIQILHIPTGIQVECQETRVQSQNRKIAMEKLQNLLLLKSKERILAEHAKARKAQVASADRSEKVRTYNFCQDRITDHRLNENYFDIKAFMKGQPERLQGIIDGLEERYQVALLDKLTHEIN